MALLYLQSHFKDQKRFYMQNILVPIDGSEPALRALKVAVKMAQKQSEDYKLHLLNVQPPLVSNNAARFFTADVLKSYYDETGEEALNDAKSYLATLDISYQAYVEVGPVVEIVKKYVAQKKCDHIVMGTRGLGAMPGLLLGSVTTKVLNAVDIPVTLVK